MQSSIASPRLAFRNLPAWPDEKPERLRINVLFTTLRETQGALKRAVELSKGLDAEVRLIVTQIVPFPLDLDRPPVPLVFVSNQIRSMANALDTDLDSHVYLCRDRLQAFLRALRQNSLTVLGLKRPWFLSRSERLARALQRKGHLVILARSA
jgi:hypothetical protein